MASPQVEDGHVRIANTVLDALTQLKVCGGQMRAVLWVIRNSWGWGKKVAPFSWSMLARALGTDRRTIKRDVAALVARRVLTIKETTIAIQKDYEKWDPCAVCPGAGSTGGAGAPGAGGTPPPGQVAHPPGAHGTGPIRSKDKQIKKGIKTMAQRLPRGAEKSASLKTGNEKKKSDYKVFMDAVFEKYFPLHPNDNDPKELKAVSKAYARWGKFGSEILAYARGDTKIALRGVDAVVDRMEAQGLNYSLRAIAGNFLNWYKNQEAYQRETKYKTR